MHASAIVFTGPDQVALHDAQIPEPGPGEVIVKTRYSCISPGTELRCLAGKQPDTVWPFIPGYALTGTVVACGPATSLREGTPVFCRGTQRVDIQRMWGGHISHAVVSEGIVYPLAEGADLVAASLGSLAAITLHGVRLSRPQLDENVAVVGLGPIGQLSARLHALAGARVVATDRLASRVELLRGVGITAFVGADDLAAGFAPFFPQGADVVVDATGAQAVVGQAMGLARSIPWGDGPAGGARYLLQGSYSAEVAIPYNEAFQKELSILVPRDFQPRDLRRALELISNGSLKLGDLVSGIYRPDQAAEVYAELRAGRGMTCVFDWES
jgi:2-desacetyl-2-hydroxyethyl bacteriochlorophyllide A dehydrogenase